MTRVIRLTAFLAVSCWSAMYGAATCSVSTSGLAFGSYDSIGTQPKDSNGTITVTCTGAIGDPVSYQVSVSMGNGTFAARKLSAGASLAAYNLYRDVARSEILGDGTGGTTTLNDAYSLQASPTIRTYAVFGRVSGSQNQLLAGGYMDNLLITLIY